MWTGPHHLGAALPTSHLQALVFAVPLSGVFLPAPHRDKILSGHSGLDSNKHVIVDAWLVVLEVKQVRSEAPLAGQATS